MGLRISKKTNQRQLVRFNKKIRIRKKILSQMGKKPRLCVFKSNRYLYAQVIDDLKGHTLVQANTKEKDFNSSDSRKSVNTAKMLGELIAKRSLQKGINNVVFDRNGYNYHGRIKAIAEGAREAGLTF